MADEELEGQQPEPTQPEEGGATEGAEPEGRRLKLGEVEVPEEELREAYQNYRNGMKWQAKLTQSSQELKLKEKELEALGEKYQKAKALEDFLSQHPDAYQEIETVFKKRTTPTGVPPEMNSVLERIRKAEESVTSRALEIRAQTEMADLERKHKEMFEGDPELRDKVIECAIKNKIPSLELAFKVVTHDTLLERGIKQGLEKAQAARKKSVELGNAAPGGSPVAKSLRDKLKGKSFDSPEMMEALMNHPAMKEEFGD